MTWIINLTYLVCGFALGTMVQAIASARRANRLLTDVTTQLAAIEAKADAALTVPEPRLAKPAAAEREQS